MKKLNNILITNFHIINLILIIFYLYPGSIAGYVVYGDFGKQPEINESFIISLNHFYAFIFLSTLGILAYRNSGKINILIKYLFLASFILEFLHFVLPYRAFQIEDLLGNFLGTSLIIFIYRLKKKYV